MTLTRLEEGSYESAKKGLCNRFDPPGRRDIYRAELQCRTKREDESWGDFDDELCKLADRAYPEFQENE